MGEQLRDLCLKLLIETRCWVPRRGKISRKSISYFTVGECEEELTFLSRAWNEY